MKIQIRLYIFIIPLLISNCSGLEKGLESSTVKRGKKIRSLKRNISNLFIVLCLLSKKEIMKEK